MPADWIKLMSPVACLPRRSDPVNNQSERPRHYQVIYLIVVYGHCTIASSDGIWKVLLSERFALTTVISIY